MIWVGRFTHYDLRIIQPASSAFAHPQARYTQSAYHQQPSARSAQPHQSRPASPLARRSLSPDDHHHHHHAHFASSARDEEEEDELEQDNGHGHVNVDALGHFANLGIASRAPSRRSSPKPYAYAYGRNNDSGMKAGYMTSPPSRAHSPTRSYQRGSNGQEGFSAASRSRSMGNVNELNALSMLASSELYELERKEREREREREHYQQQQQQMHAAPSYQSSGSYQQQPSHYHGPAGTSSNLNGSAMTPPVPPTCHHDECQRSYRTALRVYQQAQAQAQSQQHQSRSAFPSPHDEYMVSFPPPAPAPVHSYSHSSHGSGTGRVVQTTPSSTTHPSSPGSTDSSDLSRSPPTTYTRHGGSSSASHHHTHHQYNPYARPAASGKYSHPGTPRFYTPATSPVLGPVRSASQFHLSSGLPMPTRMSESAVRGGARDAEEDEDVGEMEIDMRESSSDVFL